MQKKILMWIIVSLFLVSMASAFLNLTFDSSDDLDYFVHNGAAVTGGYLRLDADYEYAWFNTTLGVGEYEKVCWKYQHEGQGKDTTYRGSYQGFSEPNDMLQRPWANATYELWTQNTDSNVNFYEFLYEGLAAAAFPTTDAYNDGWNTDCIAWDYDDEEFDYYLNGTYQYSIDFVDVYGYYRIDSPASNHYGGTQPNKNTGFQFFVYTKNAAQYPAIIDWISFETYGTIPSDNLTISATDSYNSTTLNISVEVIYNGTIYNFNGTSIDTGLSDDSYLANITINADGYDTRTFTDYNISSDITTTLNLTLGRFIFDDNIKDYEGNIISDYNVTVTDLNNASEYTCTGVGNDAICYVPKNKDYSIEVSSYGYTTGNINQSYDSSVYINVNNFTLYPFNSIRILIYDFDTLDLITQNVTIRTIGDGVALLNSTLTGNITLDFLEPYEYELRFSSDNYNQISKFITVVNDSTQSLHVYMTANTTTELQLIEVVDQNIFPIEGAIVWLQEENLDDDGNFLTIQESETNTDGIANVWVEKDVTKYYRFAVIIDGESKPILPNGNYFTTKTVFIPGVTETLRLVVDNTGASTDVITPIVEPIGELSITGSLNNTFTFTWIDGSNSISGAKLVIYSKFLNQSMDYGYVVTNSSSETSGTLTYTMPVLNNTAYRADAYFIYATRDQLVDSKEQVFDIDIFIDKNLGLLYAVFIVAGAALLTVTFGALVSVLLTVTALILLVKLNLIFLPISIITGLLALGVIMFTKLKRSM